MRINSPGAEPRASPGDVSTSGRKFPVDELRYGYKKGVPMAEHARNDAAAHTTGDGEKLWVGRCALLLLIFTPVALLGFGILTDRTNDESWAALGAIVALTLGIAGTIMGAAARATLAGRLAMWFGIVFGGLVVPLGVMWVL